MLISACSSSWPLRGRWQPTVETGERLGRQPAYGVGAEFGVRGRQSDHAKQPRDLLDTSFGAVEKHDRHPQT